MASVVDSSGSDGPQVLETSGEDSSSISNPMDELDEASPNAPPPTVAPSNTPVTGDSRQASPMHEQSSDSISDDSKEKEKHEEPVEVAPVVNGTPVEVIPAVYGPPLEVISAVYGPPEPPVPVVEKEKAPAPSKFSKSVAKESKKEEKKSSSGKSKKKEDKSIEYILRALNSLQSPEEKLAALCKKYADLHEEHRVLQGSFKTQQRSMTTILKEKDQVHCDHAKAVVAKSKLESLCRELQKQNKLIKEESIQKAREDDEKRKEISAKFQTTIGEIQTQMCENNERNNKLRGENLELAGQLKKFLEQYELREKQIDKQRQHRELEQQLADAKLQQAKAILKEEQEKNAKERELLLLKLAESSKKNTLLDAQLKVFKERYDEFETLHTRSNETFQKYKTEMDKMSKRIKKLEKDGLLWKSKWESTNKMLTEAYEARTKAEKEGTAQIQKIKKLESLCRALQAELHNKPKVEEVAKPKSNSEAVPPNTPENSSSGQESSQSSTGTPNSAQSPQPSPKLSSTSSDKQEISSTSSDKQEISSTAEADGTPSISAPAPSQDAPVPAVAMA